MYARHQWNSFSPNFKKDGDLVSIYTTKVIKMTPNVLLTRGGFLLIALLGGGDYNEVCCGLTHHNAVEILKYQ